MCKEFVYTCFISFDMKFIFPDALYSLTNLLVITADIILGAVFHCFSTRFGHINTIFKIFLHFRNSAKDICIYSSFIKNYSLTSKQLFIVRFCFEYWMVKEFILLHVLFWVVITDGLGQIIQFQEGYLIYFVYWLIFFDFLNVLNQWNIPTHIRYLFICGIWDTWFSLKLFVYSQNWVAQLRLKSIKGNSTEILEMSGSNARTN